MPTPKPRKTGRNRRPGRTSPVDYKEGSDKPRGEYMQTRMTAEDRTVWEARARAAGMTLTHWMRLNNIWAAGGSAQIVQVEFRSEYPDPPEPRPLPPGAPDPLQAMRDAVESGMVDVRGLVDRFIVLCRESSTARLIAAEIKYRLDALEERGESPLKTLIVDDVIDDPEIDRTRQNGTGLAQGAADRG